MADNRYLERNRTDQPRYDQSGRGRSMFGSWGEQDDMRASRSREDDRGQRRPDRERGQRGDRDDERFGNRDSERNIPIDETKQLIASNKVEGTPVYSRRGERLGTIYNMMIDKRSGEVKYAVMTYGGFLGMGADYYPVPWAMLRYDTREDGYHVDMDSDDLQRAPSFRRGEEPRFDREYDVYVARWYGL